ncbi:MAG: DHH family phosphoesterase [Patescibacteria group bacterium]
MELAERLKISEFENIVSRQTGNAYIIITQVDPDALGAAFGMARIFEKMNKRVKIFYSGGIAHPQNRAIVNRCNLQSRMKHLSELKEEELRANFCVLVDSSLISDPRLGELKGKINPVVAIDHHRDSDIIAGENCFMLVEDVGACCSLVVEMMKAMNIELSEDDKMLATIMAMGIYTDTKALAATHSRDLEAYAFVRQFSSQSDLNQLIDYDLPETFYRNLEEALKNSHQNNGRLVTYIGYVNINEGDDLSTIADLLVRSASVNLVIVWGIVGKVVRISARNTDISTSLGQFLRDRFGRTTGAKLAPDGRGEGGGIIELDLGLWVGETNKGKIVDMVCERIKELVFSEK